MEEYMPIKKYIEENYVPKSKIKEAKEELENIRDFYTEGRPNYRKEVEYAIEILQELLGGEE